MLLGRSLTAGRKLRSACMLGVFLAGARFISTWKLCIDMGPAPCCVVTTRWVQVRVGKWLTDMEKNFYGSSLAYDKVWFCTLSGSSVRSKGDDSALRSHTVDDSLRLPALLQA